MAAAKATPAIDAPASAIDSGIDRAMVAPSL
jgi:hypothetical protein